MPKMKKFAKMFLKISLWVVVSLATVQGMFFLFGEILGSAVFIVIYIGALAWIFTYESKEETKQNE